MLSMTVLINYFNAIFLFALVHIQYRRKSVSDFNKRGMKISHDVLSILLRVKGKKKKSHSFCSGITGQTSTFNTGLKNTFSWMIVLSSMELEEKCILPEHCISSAFLYLIKLFAYTAFLSFKALAT